MLPVTPAGHLGSPAGPGRMGAAGTPRLARAVLAQRRPAVNSAWRDGPAVPTARASAGNRPRPGAGRSPKDSAATAADGRMRPISPSTADPLLGAQRHPDGVRLLRARIGP